MRIKIYLYAESQSHSLTALEAIIGLPPSRTWLMGSLKEHGAGVYPRNSCAYEEECVNNFMADELLQQFLEKPSILSALARLNQSTDIDFGVNVVIYKAECESFPALHFSRDLVLLLAKYQLQVDIDQYRCP